NITGLDNEYFKVNQVKVLKGRSLQESDIIQGNNVVMVSTGMKEKVFKQQNPIGKIIEIRDQPMQIIGVYKSDNDFMGMESSEALIPITLWP
ncbi:ABC transporter permease, partial [Bacillus sp. TL12]|uniref:ABC transporter permease n=1 Tax=Bacillus sp. TL12 TaxID=2894756 RepID=UPI001F522894